MFNKFMYRELTGNSRYRTGLFGRQILQVQVNILKDDTEGPYGPGTESCHIIQWEDATQSDLENCVKLRNSL